MSLVSGTPIIPYVTEWEAAIGMKVSTHGKSNLGIRLLASNRLVSMEAKSVFYSKHVWVFSAWVQTYDKPFNGSSSMSQFASMWMANIKLFRHLKVSFDARDLHPEVISRSMMESDDDSCNEHSPEPTEFWAFSRYYDLKEYMLMAGPQNYFCFVR